MWQMCPCIPKCHTCQCRAPHQLIACLAITSVVDTAFDEFTDQFECPCRGQITPGISTLGIGSLRWVFDFSPTRIGLRGIALDRMAEQVKTGGCYDITR